MGQAIAVGLFGALLFVGVGAFTIWPEVKRSRANAKRELRGYRDMQRMLQGRLRKNEHQILKWRIAQVEYWVPQEPYWQGVARAYKEHKAK